MFVNTLEMPIRFVQFRVLGVIRGFSEKPYTTKHLEIHELRLSISGLYNYFMPRGTFLILVFFLIVSLLLTYSSADGQRLPEKDYLFYVLSESADKITLIRFGPKGARVERSVDTGSMPTDIDGPHGIAISPDKKFYYVSLSNGRPFGSVWKYSVENDVVLSRVQLGYFPATMDLSKDGQFLYVVNFNLHGDMVPSSVSVVATGPMMEVARIATCTMPHGSRFNAQGTKHYSACMMDDTLVEIDTSTLKVSRHFMLTRGREMGMAGAPSASPITPPKNSEHKHNNTGGHGMDPPKPGDDRCSPTWAQPSIEGSSVFVACNNSNEIVEVDAATWKVNET